MKKVNKKIIDYLIYLLFFIFLAITVSLKTNYHIDEFYSFNLANHEGISYLKFEDGVKYDSYNDIFLEYTSVSNNNRFNIGNVWQNQKNDVHPPLYYLLLNFICSINSQTFSKCYPATINIVSALLTLFFIKKIINELTNNKIIVYIVSFVYILTTGLMDDVAFFRMYELSMLWVSIGSYLFIKQISNKQGKKFYIPITIITFLGAMTHYYCILFFVLISITYGVYLLINKDFKDVLYFCLSMIIAGLVSIVVFPGMINHIFNGYRGEETINNLLNLNDYITRFIIFFKQLSNEIFGNLLLFLLPLFFVVLIICLIKKKIVINDLKKYIIILIPCVIYFLVVVKAAAYLNERYISIIYPVLLSSFLCLLYELILKIINVKNIQMIVISLLSIAIIVNGFISAKWTYLYQDSKETIENSKKYSNVDCICLYDDINTNILYNSIELMNYKTVTFIKSSDIQNLKDFSNEKKLVIKLFDVNNKDEIINQISYILNIKNVEFICEARNGVNYYLY